MSEKEEGIHKVSREPCGCVRKPEQDTNRGAQVIKRAVLSAEDRMRLIVVNHVLGNYTPPPTGWLQCIVFLPHVQ